MATTCPCCAAKTCRARSNTTAPSARNTSTGSASSSRRAMSFKIGVDGGGTKTECILIDAQGNIVGRHLAPGCNPSVVGPEQARMIVTDALCQLVQNALGRP